MARVTRHFVTVGDRRVHYRRAGAGPAVILLHASPRSSTELAATQDVFARHFTTIALDTPGFGLSDPLPLEQPETGDYADALAATLDALGIAEAAVYGRHTGASIALEFAVRYPARCRFLLTNGLPIYSAAQREDRLTRYLSPIVPGFAGDHLIWMWFRFRDQHVFWPWHEQDLAHRAQAELPDLVTQHRGVMELLEAGDAYRVGYATAFRYDSLAALAQLRVPACLGNRPSDSLFRTVPLYPEGAPVRIFPAGTQDAAEAELAVLREVDDWAAPPLPPEALPPAGRTRLRFIGDVLVRSAGEDRAGVPVLMLHRVPGSSRLHDALVWALGATRPVHALDLPGQGESALREGDTIAQWAAAVEEVLDALGLPCVHVVAQNGGAAVAVELALRAPARIASLVLDAPIVLPDDTREAFAAQWLAELGDTTPCREGGHLLRAWHMLRDLELWWPWHARAPATARGTPPRISPERLNDELREAMKQPEGFAQGWEAVLRYPLARRLAMLRQPCALMAEADDPFAALLPEAAAALPDAVRYEGAALALLARL
jgi:pimeloyl-ACP methyl ester carboxylesterase